MFAKRAIPDQKVCFFAYCRGGQDKRMHRLGILNEFVQCRLHVGFRMPALSFEGIFKSIRHIPGFLCINNTRETRLTFS